ncbi:glycoside hydrolase 43 family protein [Altererythrobacter lauratis]|uniref:Glycoside hydrolase 43 family protein n=1 Tax=Alteraurantiacibacter lauratis TaxID=2054627 RepID=A0ABV7EDY0_9SPHN
MRFWLGILALFLVVVPAAAQHAPATGWTADNGNGTFTNPLFQDEFSDPDIIRVGEDYYMTGTTMHMMPGLPLLHSRDLVNWRLVSYAFDRLDLGPAWRMEQGQEIYGQGIWAPSLRYHDGTFHIFANVNGHGLQHFATRDPAGPWTHRSIPGDAHDISVLFDDDGRVWAVTGYDEVRLIEMERDLSGFIPGTERVIIPAGNAMGEGHHFYKIDGRYWIISANYAPTGRMQAARADRLDGPWETAVISAGETMGTQRGWWLADNGLGKPLPGPGAAFEFTRPASANAHGATPLHQGGLVQLPNGDWWGFSMMDTGAMGRTTFLSPVHWQDGWPMFGLPGNPGRSPRTWVKPATGHEQPPTPAWDRYDTFDGPALQPVWQWNHHPDDSRWSLTERPGFLRLRPRLAPDFLRARGSVTQRAVAPLSEATALLDASGLAPGDIAGLGLLNLPHATLGVMRDGDAYALRLYDQASDTESHLPLPGHLVHLRLTFDAQEEAARFSYSRNGTDFTPVGGAIRTPYQLKTFQGVRFALFAYSAVGESEGWADFDHFTVTEPLADRSRNLPLGRVITIHNLADESLAWANPHGMLHHVSAASDSAAGAGVRFRVHDRGLGRVALEAVESGRFLAVTGAGLAADVRLIAPEGLRDENAVLFQWQDMLGGEFMLLSLATHRYIGIAPGTGDPYSADLAGAAPDRRNGAVLRWQSAE